MTMSRAASKQDIFAESLLSNGYVPRWEVKPKRVPVPTPSPDALAAAYCEKSPTRMHHWLVSEPPVQKHVCKWCHSTYTIGRLPLVDEMVAWPQRRERGHSVTL